MSLVGLVHDRNSRSSIFHVLSTQEHCDDLIIVHAAVAVGSLRQDKILHGEAQSQYVSTVCEYVYWSPDDHYDHAESCSVLQVPAIYLCPIVAQAAVCEGHMHP